MIIAKFNKAIREFKIGSVHKIVPKYALSVSVKTGCAVTIGKSMENGNPIQILYPIDSLTSMIF